jgi:hypothetical protein
MSHYLTQLDALIIFYNRHLRYITVTVGNNVNYDSRKQQWQYQPFSNYVH